MNYRLKVLSNSNPVRLNVLEDKLKQKRLAQQLAWQSQAKSIYQLEEEQKQAKIRAKQAAKLKITDPNNAEEDSDNEELRAMLHKDGTANKSGFNPNWLDSNHNAGSGSTKRFGGMKSLPNGRGCGPSS